MLWFGGFVYLFVFVLAFICLLAHFVLFSLVGGDAIGKRGSMRGWRRIGIHDVKPPRIQ